MELQHSFARMHSGQTENASLSHVIFYRKSGQNWHACMYVSVVKDERERLSHFVIIVEDITRIVQESTELSAARVQALESTRVC